MSHGPITPRELAEEAVRGELTQWMIHEAGRTSPGAVADRPVSLVPTLALRANPTLGTGPSNAPAPVVSLAEGNRQWLRVWFSEKDETGRETVESVMESLKWLNGIVVVCCSGNCDGIALRVSASRPDSVAVGNLLAAAMPSSHIEAEGTEFEDKVKGLDLQRLSFRALVPPVPYWGVFSSGGAGFTVLFTTLMGLDPSEFAVCQTVIQPVSAQWRSAMRLMARTEFLAAERTRALGPWVFSKGAANAAEEKLSGCLYAVSTRLALYAGGEDRDRSLWPSLLLPFSGLRFSGGAIDLVTEEDFFAASLSRMDLAESLITGSVFQHGAILSPSEVALVAPFPSAEDVTNQHYRLDRVPTVIADLAGEDGIFLANELVFGREQPVVWPHKLRPRHMLITGTIGRGKTSCVAGLGAQIVNAGRCEGLALIDPHNTAIAALAPCIEDGRLDDCILSDPMDDDYVLCLPLFDCPNPDQVDTAVSNITHQICALFSRSDMGFHIVRGISNTVRTLLLCDDLSLLDVRRLLDPGGRGAEQREKVCAGVDDELLIEYWSEEFPRLDAGGPARIRSRLDYLLRPRRLRPLLANRICKVSYKEIIEDGKILLARTSPAQAGAELAGILETLHLTGLQSAATTRRGEAGKRPVFTIVADEFGNYCNPRTVSHALRTLRKFDVSEILVTQNVESLPADVLNAIGNIGTHVVFQQGWQDAQHYFKTFCGAIPVHDFMTKNVGEGYVKMGRRFAAIKTDLPVGIRDADESIAEIRRNTREKYCIPIGEFRDRMVEEHHVSLAALKGLDVI